MSTAGASRAILWGAASERGSRQLQITKARRPCTTVTHLRNDEALRIVSEEECDPSAARSPVRHSSARAMEELVHCVRRMVQREAGLNGFCGGGPDEGLGVPVGGGNVAGDRAFEVVDRAKDAPFEALPSELGEEAFHGIEPGAGGRREVERPSWMLCEPGQHLRMFVGGLIVEDGVDHLAGWHGPLDGCDDPDELLMSMARHAATDDLAFEHADRGEQGRRAVPFLIVREGRAFPPL